MIKHRELFRITNILSCFATVTLTVQFTTCTSQKKPIFTYKRAFLWALTSFQYDRDCPPAILEA